MKRKLIGFSVLLPGLCLSPGLLRAGDPQLGIPGLGKKQSEEQRREKAARQEAKNESRYEKLKAYSRDKYENDPDFKDEVDERFNDLLREHSERAYENNVERASFMRVVHEDNWRVHYKLYDNLRVQDHINRIGQRLVPADSEQLFAFKVTPSPIPYAETLATGTIYISSGLISLLDNEAQLSFVLAHEMAHVELNHWKERAMMEVGQDRYAADQQKKVARLTLLGSIAGAAIGAGVNGGTGAGYGAMAGAAGGFIAGMLLNRPLIVSWDKVQEDKADEMAFKQVLSVNYDVREVPKLYIAVENASKRDTRVGLGFIGDRRRLAGRKEKAADLIANAYKAEIELKLQKGEFVGDSPEHRNLMGELKRDNGIMAYYHDMFEMARSNLKEAVAIRENDSAAQYFYGKVMKLVGRTPEDRKEAQTAFANAVKYDFRHQQYGANLHYALSLMEENQEQNKPLINTAFDAYVSNYAYWLVESRQMSFFPPNLDPIYEYMRLYADPGWRPKPPDLKDLTLYNRTLGAYLGDVPPQGPVTAAAAMAPSSGAISGAANAVDTAKKVRNAVQSPGSLVKPPLPIRK